jgi:tetratricopeptide (TPR) repeat protein
VNVIAAMQETCNGKPDARKAGLTVKNWEQGLIGWSPSLVGVAVWILSGLHPRSRDPAFLTVGFFAAVMISVVMHEIAHFISGRLLGLNPWWLTIGFGATVLKKQFRSFNLTLKAYPYSGAVYSSLFEVQQSRWKRLLMVAAGPLSNAGLLCLFARIAVHSHAPSLNATQAISWEMAGANAYLLLTSLVPFYVTIHGAKVPNDGMQLFQLLANRSPERPVASWRRAVNEIEPEMLLAAYRSELANPALTAEERSAALDGFATGVLMYGAHEFLPEADRYSEELLRLNPAEWTVKGTRGSILVEKGELDAGIAMLSEVIEKDQSAFDRAISASFLALAELKKQNPESARNWLRYARNLDPDCVSMHRVEAMIEPPNPLVEPSD